MSDKVFWFTMAFECLVCGVFAMLYYPQYRKEIAMLAVGFVFLLYAAWFALVAGLVVAPEAWLTGIGVALLAALGLLAIVLIWRVWNGDGN